MELLLNEIFTESLRNYASVIPDLVEPVLSVAVKGILYLVNAFFGNRFDYPDYYYVPVPLILICIGLFLVGKLFSSVSFSKSIAMILYSRLEILLSLVLLFVRAYQNFKMADYIFSTHRSSLPETGLYYILFVLVLPIFFLMVSLVTWFFVSCMWYAALGYQQNFMQYPFVTFFTEVIRTLLYFLLFAVSVAFPLYGYPIWGVILATAILLYPDCKKMLDYFYFQDILTFRYTVMDRGKPVVHESKRYIPGELRKKLPDHPFCVGFLIRKSPKKKSRVRTFDKVFVTVENGFLTLYYKTFYGMKFRKVEYPKAEYFFTEGSENYTIFTIDGPKEEIVHLFKRPERDFVINVSKANTESFLKITGELQAIDYEELSRELMKDRVLY